VVQNLENRNISTVAGSGSNQNDEMFFEQVLRETNDDDIENMEDLDENENLTTNN